GQYVGVDFSDRADEYRFERCHRRLWAAWPLFRDQARTARGRLVRSVRSSCRDWHRQWDMARLPRFRGAWGGGTVGPLFRLCAGVLLGAPSVVLCWSGPRFGGILLRIPMVARIRRRLACWFRDQWPLGCDNAARGCVGPGDDFSDRVPCQAGGADG